MKRNIWISQFYLPFMWMTRLDSTLDDGVYRLYTEWKMIFPLNFCTREIKRFSHLNDRFSFFHHSVLPWLYYLFISFCPIVKAIKENTFTGSGTGLVGLRLRENPFPYSNATNETRILFLCFYVCFFCVYNKNSKRKKISHPTIVVSLTTNIPFT